MDSLVSLKHKTESRTDYDQCIICQERKKSDHLRHQSDTGLAKIWECANKRIKSKDTKYRDAVDRIQNTPHGTKLMWHKQCYSSFTHKENLARLECQDPSSSKVRSPVKLRSSMSPMKWELCLFCQTQEIF